MRRFFAMHRALHKLLFSPLEFAESRPFSTSALIFLLGFSVRLALLIVTDTWPDAENYELVHVAWSVARGDGFSNPFQSGNTGPTAHVAPVYPYLLAAIYKTFGFINFADLVKQVLACAVASLTFALLPAVAQAAGIARRVGILGGTIGALTPMSIDVEVIGRWETHIATLLFVLALLYWLRHFRQGALSWRQGALSGFLWGLLLLTSPSFVTVLSAFVIFTVIRKSSRTRATLSYLATVLLVTAAVLMPWTVRNYRTFGSFVFVRDNAGLEFHLSNLPNAKRSMNDNLLAGAGKLHPFGSASSRQRIQGIGEAAFSRECMRKFIDNVKAEPATFARRFAQRILWMWFPVGEHSIRDSMLPRDIIACVITLLGFLGLYSLPGGEAKKIFAIALFSYPLAYYLIQTTMRYRLPIVWITCLLCAHAVLVLAHKFAEQDSPEPYLSTTLSNMS